MYRERDRKNPREEIVKVRLNSDELEKAQWLAEQKNIPLATAVREILMMEYSRLKSSKSDFNHAAA